MQHGASVRIACVGFFRDVVKRVEHQQCLLQLLRSLFCELGVVEQLDERSHVVAAVHIAQQGDGIGAGDQRRGGLATNQRRQEPGLDVRRFVHPGRDPVGDQVEQECCVLVGRALQGLD